MQAVGLPDAKYETRDSIAQALTISEYGYYFVILYTIFGAPLGLILSGGVGAGFLLVLVLTFCAVALGTAIFTVLSRAWMPLACGVSHLFIQLVLHGESMYAMYLYQFGPWLLSVIIVQSLAMHRPNFLHRFASFTFFMGVAMLPSMSLVQTGAYERIGFGSDSNLGYSNGNAIAAWFGFCSVYMTIKGYLEARARYRAVLLLTAVFSFYVLTLTASRGALVSVAISLLAVSSRFVKLGLWPSLLLAAAIGGMIQLGFFDQQVHSYSLRAGEETGRFYAWPRVIDQFLDSPFIGNGASHTGAITSQGELLTPHNPFLLIAGASGVIPLFLFCAYCVKSAYMAFRASRLALHESPFHLSLVIYTIFAASGNNLEFMTPWAVVSLAMPLAIPVSANNPEHTSPTITGYYPPEGGTKRTVNRFSSG
jgi:O-antigen ligase